MVLWCHNEKDDFMAYFFKSNLKKGIYLQIYESFYNPERKETAHHSYKALGYVHKLIDKGIDDPVSFYKNEITKLNRHHVPFVVILLLNFNWLR